MLHKTSGIILHTTKYSETSLIAKVYTSDFGLQSYIISGVRGKKSKNKATLFQPLALVDMVVANSAKGTLQRISEINSLHPYNTIPYNIIKSSIVLFLNEVLYRSLKEEHADSDLFEFIKNSLLILDLKTDNCSNFHIYFMLQLSRFLGFYPQGELTSDKGYFDLQEGRFTDSLPRHAQYLTDRDCVLLSTFLKANYETITDLKVDKLQRKQLLQYIIMFYQMHITSFGEIKSYDVLEEVIA